MALVIELGIINMMHFQNGIGTAQQIFLLVQYSSHREKMLMQKGTALSCYVPLRIMRTVAGMTSKREKEKVRLSLKLWTSLTFVVFFLFILI